MQAQTERQMEVRQIIQDKGSLIRWGRSLDLDGSAKERIDAKADLFVWVVNRFNDYSFDERVKRGMLNLKPEIIGK